METRHERRDLNKKMVPAASFIIQNTEIFSAIIMEHEDALTRLAIANAVLTRVLKKLGATDEMLNEATKEELESFRQRQIEVKKPTTPLAVDLGELSDA